MSQVCQTRFGELLGRMVPLSGHDVEEILNEQAVSHRRFGEIALSWGLCQPEHVWNAWLTQLGDEMPMVDLDECGVDCQALALLTKEQALAQNAIPIRLVDGNLLIAVSGAPAIENVVAMVGAPGISYRFVRADAEQISQAIHSHYDAMENSVN